MDQSKGEHMTTAEIVAAYGNLNYADLEKIALSPAQQAIIDELKASKDDDGITHALAE